MLMARFARGERQRKQHFQGIGSSRSSSKLYSKGRFRWVIQQYQDIGLQIKLRRVEALLFQRTMAAILGVSRICLVTDQ